MGKFKWENGKLVKNAVVTIDGVEHEVTPAVVEGATAVSAENLNEMQDGIYEDMVQLDENGKLVDNNKNKIHFTEVVNLRTNTEEDQFKTSTSLSIADNFNEYDFIFVGIKRIGKSDKRVETDIVSINNNSKKENNDYCFFRGRTSSGEKTYDYFNLQSYGVLQMTLGAESGFYNYYLDFVIGIKF